jgi:hypothetical protein
MVILDDRAARSFAEVMGVTFLGTAGMLFQAFVRKHLTLAELEDAVSTVRFGLRVERGAKIILAATAVQNLQTRHSCSQFGLVLGNEELPKANGERG